MIILTNLSLQEKTSGGSRVKRLIIFLILISLALIHIFNLPVYGQASLRRQVLGTSTNDIGAESFVKKDQRIKTVTAFSQEEVKEYEDIPFEIEYTKDKEMEYGEEKILLKGENGVKTYTYLLTFWDNEIINKQLIKTDTKNPINEKIARGTKIIWRLYQTPDIGRVKYWYKLRVWATKYDANCFGCGGRTFSGTEVKKGVCAVDPKVIQLGTNFYVDGYGFCRAEDIGGAIKGDKIDLGFVDASKGAWGAAFTYIYLLSNPPQE